MAEFVITQRLTCDSLEQAQRVAAERLAYDEDYGFDYQWTSAPEVSEVKQP